MARRLQAMGQPRYADGFSVSLHEDLVSAPNAWVRPRLVFVNSMSDLFHEAVPGAFIERVFQTMGECPQHVFQILTKRGARLRELAPRLPWSRNIWIGVTVEDRQAKHRIGDLLEVPASTRFLSCEPLLETLGELSLDGIDWVIVGGESGPGARPMRQEWVEEVLAQCRQQQVPFFFKQWGGPRKKRAGRTLHGRTYDEYPRSSVRAGSETRSEILPVAP
jgi:protein gp37